jgi:glycosyltransferase 2 family protein
MSSRRWRLAAGAVLAIVLLALFFRGVDWQALGAAFRSANHAYLAAVAAVTVVTYLLRAWRWGSLLRPLARVPLRDLFPATLVGFMTALLVPRAGEVVRPYLISRRHPIRTSAGFAAIILERLVDLITVLVLFALYLYVLPTPAAQTRGPLLGFLKLGGALAGLGALAVLGVLLLLHGHAEAVVRLLRRVLAPLPQRWTDVIAHAVAQFAQGLAVLKASPGHLLAIFGQSVLVWLSICLGIWCNNLAFGLALPFYSSFLMVAFLTVGVAVPTPGTVGGFHEFYLLALTQAFGVEKGTAAAAGIACHVLTNLPVLVLGLAFLGREGLTMGKVADLTDRPPDEPSPGPPPEEPAAGPPVARMVALEPTRPR